MKKYLLIPILFIAALATASAGCGTCAEKECAEESKKSCCPSEATETTEASETAEVTEVTE